MSEKQKIIEEQIDSLRYKQAEYEEYAQKEAKRERYDAACEYQYLSKGIGIAIEKLTNNKREAAQ